MEQSLGLVRQAQVQSASLRNPLPLLLHAYITPYLILWPAFLAIYLSPEQYDKRISSSEWTFVWVGTIFTFQALTWLTTKWSITLRALFTTTTAPDVRAASLIQVMPIANAGSAEICKLDRDQRGQTSFLFQKRRFLYSPENGYFETLRYKLDEDPAPLIKTFQQTNGITSAEEVDCLTHHYGPNTFDIPVPTFTELFQEHAVAPFFVFQIFCVGLWLLDEYWYYSLFTLFMLVVFESTVVWQRQRTLMEFRGMSVKPYNLWVHRSSRWEEITSDKLLPGDLVSVQRTKDDGGVACDMILLRGGAIVNEAMLSGESTPLLKESIQLRPPEDQLEPEGIDKNAFLYGGTKVLQVSPVAQGDEVADVSLQLKPPPDDGALAVVARTGFETSQGSLVRTMIYSTERVSANNVEALLFILFLLVFALAASWYVWQEGVAKDRKRSKLLLDCILIITSVVPPELPMELSLAVNTSLAALSKYAIFCTEPFRIPYAGRVDIACFDKTGTLTGEDLVVEGIAGLSLTTDSKEAHSGAYHVTPVLETGQTTMLVLASAHALVRLDEGEIVGDPMEKATLAALKWTLGRNDTVTSNRLAPAASGKSFMTSTSIVQIKRRFQFSSALKRQSSVSVVIASDPKTSKKTKSTLISVKGAPETIGAMLVNKPPHFDETFKHFTRKGSRVLALGYRYLSQEGDWGQGRINNLERDEVESGLQFAGFLVLQCPLKPDAIEAVRMLNESSHRVIMITGDNPLTAVHVARQVEIVDREVLILDAKNHIDGPQEINMRSVDEQINLQIPLNQPIPNSVLADKDLCVTGQALRAIKGGPAYNQILRHAWVYARVSPKQKEELLISLKEEGFTTLMCGDGTNDVGALKQAHIGVALLNGTKADLERMAEIQRTTKMKEIYEKQSQIMKRFNQPVPPVPLNIAHLYPPGPTNPNYEKAKLQHAQKRGTVPNGVAPEIVPVAEDQSVAKVNGNLTAEQKKQQKVQQAAASFADKMQAALMSQEEESEAPTIKLGDASVAAPFTSKLANVIAIPNIIRQGRCTLVATIQMYKILALNCLISAYSLSVLYLDGIKFSDSQVTISGMLMSVCFLSISRAKSVEGLSKERPQPNIFNWYIIGSILGQFAIHIVTLIYVSSWVKNVEPTKEKVDLEKEFEPSLLNSAIYLLQLVQQVSTFAANYQGQPFRESISQNRGMFYGLILVSGVAFSCATEFVPELNEKLKMVSFSMDFKIMITTIMVLDFVGCWVVEKSLKSAFSDYKPKPIAERRPDQLKREYERKAAQQVIEDRRKEEWDGRTKKAAEEKVMKFFGQKTE